MYPSHELEAVRKRAMFQCFSYEEVLVKASLVTLSGRRRWGYNLRKSRQFNLFFLRHRDFKIVLLFLAHLQLKRLQIPVWNIQ